MWDFIHDQIHVSNTQFEETWNFLPLNFLDFAIFSVIPIGGMIIWWLMEKAKELNHD